MTQRHCALSLLILALSLLLPLNRAAAQATPQPNPCVDWVNVQSWRGSFTVSGGGTFTEPSSGAVTTISESGTVTLTGTDSANGPCRATESLYQWPSLPGQASISDVSIHDITLTPSHDALGNPCTFTTTTDIDGGTSQTGVSITLDFTNKACPIYKIAPSSLMVDGVTVKGSGCGFTGQPATYMSEPWGPAIDSIAQTSLPLPSFGPNLPVSIPLIQANGGFGGGLIGPTTWSVSGSLIPFLPPLDVVVMIPQYATWRPVGGSNETDMQPGVPGNILGIQAQLIRMDTMQNATTIEPDGWTFNLVDVSHEPGVALNWPAQANLMNPSPPDLAFNQTINQLAYPTLTLAGDLTNPGNGTILQLLDPLTMLAPSFINLALFSFDWGAWATLHVTAVVNGQQIQGHIVLDNGQNATDILIPQRQTNSHIADVWKTHHNVALSTPDDDDSELDPSGYPGCLGDGFTLYEEYRGFMENGKHIEGDPNAKDYFVENLIGADAEPGIFLFTELTGLSVHKDILKAETKIDHANGSAGSILINFNHAQGAHVTDQHGVTIATQYTEPGSFRRMDGGLTILSEAGFHAKPRIVDGIAMQPRDAPGSLNPGNTHGSNISGGVITAVDALLQYDIGVAHELMHSVGVDHHGDGDTFEAFYFRAPDDPQNTTGRPSYFVYDSNQGQYVPVRIVPEQGGADPADTFWQKIQAGVTRCRAVVASPSQYPKILVDGCTYALQQLATNFQLLKVGSPHREHSGNDQCLMRYFFAQVYPAEAVSNTYYLVPAGTEPVGSMLCDAAVGTGVNDPNRTPQPRYFDASPGRGGCKFWVCVSDNKNYPLVPN